MKKRMLITVFILLLCVTSSAVGYYGNIIYPTFDSYKPNKPFSREQWELDRYRRDVEDYVQDCEEYVRNAENDIRAIQQAIKSAISDANNAVEEYNSFLRTGF